MGAIPSVSLPSLETCIPCDCQRKCYARKIERLRPNVAASYKQNLQVLRNDKDTYWREVEAAIMTSRFFRFHVSGDIPDADYFNCMVEVAKRQPHCAILCFTKKYDIINEYITLHGLEPSNDDLCANIIENCVQLALPENLHIVFSAWVGLEMVNPFAFPEAHVRYRDGTTTADLLAKECGGNCTECAIIDGGCWTLQQGEQVIFNEH